MNHITITIYSVVIIIIIIIIIITVVISNVIINILPILLGSRWISSFQGTRIERPPLLRRDRLAAGVPPKISTSAHSTQRRSERCRCFWYWLLWRRGHQGYQGECYITSFSSETFHDGEDEGDDDYDCDVVWLYFYNQWECCYLRRAGIFMAATDAFRAIKLLVKSRCPLSLPVAFGEENFFCLPECRTFLPQQTNPVRTGDLRSVML